VQAARKTLETSMANTTGRKFGGRKKGTPNKSTFEIRTLAQEYGPEAIRRLVSLMRQSDDRKLQFAAARELLYRGYGPPQEPEDSEPSFDFHLEINFVDPNPAAQGTAPTIRPSSQLWLENKV
jgi:hypothetical protein